MALLTTAKPPKTAVATSALECHADGTKDTKAPEREDASLPLCAASSLPLTKIA